MSEAHPFSLDELDAHPDADRIRATMKVVVEHAHRDALDNVRCADPLHVVVDCGCQNSHGLERPRHCTCTKPRVGATITTFANALYELAELMTQGQRIHGGDWEGGRMSGPEKIEDAVDSLGRHLLAMAQEDLDPDTGLPHRVALLANALIIVELCARYPDHVKGLRRG